MSGIVLELPAPVPLIDQEPVWVHSPARIGVGVSFLCPCRKMGLGDHQHRLTVLFLNPLAGAKPLEDDTTLAGNNGGYRWARSGLTFEDLHLSPNVDAASVGCWNGYLHDGQLRLF